MESEGTTGDFWGKIPLPTQVSTFRTMTQRRCARIVRLECPDPGTCALLRARRESLRILSARRLDVDTHARVRGVQSENDLRVQVVSLIIIFLKVLLPGSWGEDSPG